MAPGPPESRGDHDEVVELAEDADAGLMDRGDDGFSVAG
jgi:hypothetical protein